MGGFVGAGRFYVGDYVLGSIKLFLPAMGCVVGCIVGMIALNDEDDDSAEQPNFMETFKKGGIASGICGCSCCVLQVWWLVDWIMFACNAIPDANGKTLYPMS